ncbi:MAG TPA: hypothetical protein VGM56_09655, partial [Byssovorax sp.]
TLAAAQRAAALAAADGQAQQARAIAVYPSHVRGIVVWLDDSPNAALAPSPVTDALGAALVTLLARTPKTELHYAKDGYYSSDYKTKIVSVDVLGDHNSVVVSPAPPGHDPPTLSTTLGMVVMPSNPNVTAEDVLRLFAYHEIRISNTATAYVALSSVVDGPLKPLFDGAVDPLSADASKAVSDFSDHLGALDAEVNAMLTAQAKTTPPEGTDAFAEAKLGAWLLGSGALAACDPAIASNEVTCVATHPDAWPGFDRKTSPLAILKNRIDGALAARTTYKAAFGKVQADKTLVTAALPEHAALTQSSWIFTYLTPVIGVGVVPAIGNDSAVVLAYSGVQLHFCPNNVDDPQWSKGVDAQELCRAFAIEAALGLSSGPFGDAGRYSSLSGFPPVFAGAAVHVIPYTSVSGGAVLLNERSSTVVEEEGNTKAFFYLGLNVQANIPDLVMALKGRTSATSAGN